jgi:hypothetical protein
MRTCKCGATYEVDTKKRCALCDAGYENVRVTYIPPMKKEEYEVWALMHSSLVGSGKV